MKEVWLHIAKISFWVLTALTSLSFLILIVLSFPSDGMDSGITAQYSVSLSFLFIIISVFSVVMIFLFQHINSTYNTEELEKPPIFLKYFVGILGILLFYAFLNLLALYFKLGTHYEFMSFIYSLFLIFFIPITIIFAYYNTKPSIVLGIISEDIIKFIRKNKKFEKTRIPEEACQKEEVSYSEEFIKELNERVSIFIKNTKRAIKNDQEVIFRTSLKNLREICREYLKQSKHVQNIEEDKFLFELNIQFNFIITESLNSSNTKLLEDLAETIGEITKDVVRYRKVKSEPDIYNWIKTLKDLFINAYPKKKTKACYDCLDKINEVALSALDERIPGPYLACCSSLEDIYAEMRSKTDDYWAIFLSGRVLKIYQDQFLKFLDMLKKDKRSFKHTFIMAYFERMWALINRSIDETKMMNYLSRRIESKRAIFNHLYGSSSLSLRISKMQLNKVEDTKTKIHLFIYIREFVYFNKRVTDKIITGLEDNLSIVYNYFPEALFLITKYINLEEKHEKGLIKALSDNLLDCIKKKYVNRLDSYIFRQHVHDYLALLIYLHHEKAEIIKEITQKLVDLYNQIKKMKKSRNQEMARMLLYKELKLYSCWINQFPNLKEANEPIINLLISDFESASPPKTLPILSEKYGYSGIVSDEGWSLGPSEMWDNEFKNEISEKLNGPEGKNYIKLHEMLKSKQKEQNKKRRTQQIRRLKK